MHLQKNRALRIKSTIGNKEEYTREAVMDCMLNTLLSRSAIIASAYAAASALSFGGCAASAIVGSTMGCAYAHNQNRKNPEPEAAEMESIKTEKNQETEPDNAVKINDISYL